MTFMFVYLDTETTGLSAARGDTIVEISIIDHYGSVLLDTLVNPLRDIPYGASAVHGITSDMVSSSPTLDEILPEIDKAVKENDVVIYNSSYDVQFFPDKLSKARSIICAMKSYSSTIGSKRWIKLEEAAKHVGHKWQGEAHRALADTQACRSVWKWLLKKDPSLGKEEKSLKSGIKWRNKSVEKKIIICGECKVSLRASIPLGRKGHVSCPKCGGKTYVSS